MTLITNILDKICLSKVQGDSESDLSLTLRRPRLVLLVWISPMHDKLSLVESANSCILDSHFYGWKKTVAKLATALDRTQAGEGQGLPGGW